MTEGDFPGPERRAHARFPLRGRVQVEFEQRRYFLTENVVAASAGGFYVQSEQPASAGERITFDLRMTSEGPVFSGTGEVSWVRAEPEDGFVPGFGVSFIRLEPQGAQLLLDLSDAFDQGGEEALLHRLDEAVAVWKAGQLDDTATSGPMEDTETLLKDTTEMQPLPMDDADTDPLILAPNGEEVPVSDTAEEAIDEPEPAAEGDEEAGDTLEIGAEERDADETAPAATSGRDLLGDGDVLSKTLDLGDARSVHALRNPGKDRRPVPIWPVLLTAGLLVGGILWITSPSELPAPAAAVASEPSASEGPEAAAPQAASEVVGSPDQESAPFQGIRDIRWRRDGTGLRIIVEFDGVLPENGYAVHRPGADPPREVVQIFGVVAPYPVGELVVDAPELDRIRIGHHENNGDAEDRIVLDLPERGVQLLSVEGYSGELHLFLERARNAGRAPGPN